MNEPTPLDRVFEALAEGVVVLDAAGRVTRANRAAEKLLGAAAATITGCDFGELGWRRLTPDGPEPTSTQPPAGHLHRRLFSGEPALAGELLWLQPPGLAARVVSLSAQPLRDAAGQHDGAVLSLIDITARWHAERARDGHQARLAAVVEGASDAVISVDLQGRVSMFNPAAERIFGRAAAQVLGGPLDLLLPAAQQAHHGAMLRRFADDGVSRRAMGAGRVQGRHADGRVLELEASISKVDVDGQQVLTAILRDVTERVARDVALQTSQRELAQLNHRLLEQEKDSSHRLARALHDELGQTLSALRWQWEAWRAESEEPGGPEPVDGPRDGRMDPRVVERMGQLVVAANQQIRSAMRDLCPPLLDELGLEAALDNELQQQRPVADVPRLVLEVPARLQGRRWPPDVEYAAFMIGREALLNALQHARAQDITVALDGDDLELQLRVHDDGVGIAAEVRDGRAGHLGLVGMRERARAIGAALQWDSAPGQGTTVLLRWQADIGPASGPVSPGA